jgi:prepilin-type processing-associated H-X9-DG protein
VINSKLNQSLPVNQRLWIGSIPRPSQTAVIVEMRSVPEELPPGDPHRNASLDRAKADWQRFAARHRNGGHIAMADGSARHFENKYVTTPVGGNYNKADIIWNPLGVAN